MRDPVAFTITRRAYVHNSAQYINNLSFPMTIGSAVTWTEVVLFHGRLGKA